MNDKFVDMPKCMADKYETADFIASDPRPVPKAVFRAGRGGQRVYHLVALVREPKGDHRGRRSGWTGSLVAVLTGG